MNYLISTLAVETEELERFAHEIDALEKENIGVELIAFTHDDAYWHRLEKLLPTLTCPRSFHGPYVEIEATASPNSLAQKKLFADYEKVFQLAKEYQVDHVVFHYSQLEFEASELEEKRAYNHVNIVRLLSIAEKYQVKMAIENLAFRNTGIPLYNNEELIALLERYPTAPILLDIGHAHINKLDIPSFIKRFHNRIVAYHLNNNNGKIDEHKRVREGSIDYTEIMPIIKKYSPDADIVLEYEPHTEVSVNDCLEDIVYLDRL